MFISYLLHIRHIFGWATEGQPYKRKSLSLTDWVLDFPHWPLLFQNDRLGLVLYANEPVQRDTSGSRNLDQTVKLGNLVLKWNEIPQWHNLFLA